MFGLDVTVLEFQIEENLSVEGEYTDMWHPHDIMPIWYCIIELNYVVKQNYLVNFKTTIFTRINGYLH
jgi:hypothetical protein